MVTGVIRKENGYLLMQSHHHFLRSTPQQAKQRTSTESRSNSQEARRRQERDTADAMTRSASARDPRTDDHQETAQSRRKGRHRNLGNLAQSRVRNRQQLRAQHGAADKQQVVIPLRQRLALENTPEPIPDLLKTRRSAHQVLPQKQTQQLRTGNAKSTSPRRDLGFRPYARPKRSRNHHARADGFKRHQHR